MQNAALIHVEDVMEEKLKPKKVLVIGLKSRKMEEEKSFVNGSSFANQTH